MNNESNREFETAYLQTDYVVRDGAENQIIFHIGEKNSALDELLKRYEANSWAFVTAYNPLSEQLPAEENVVRQTSLLRRLKEKNFQYLNGYGQTPNEDWPAEPSVFILNVDRKTAIAIGNEFGQNAIVVGQIGVAPELVWCLEAP